MGNNQDAQAQGQLVPQVDGKQEDQNNKESETNFSVSPRKPGGKSKLTGEVLTGWL